VEGTTLHVLVVVFLATTVRSAFGFGEALIAVPLLAFLIPVEEAVPLATLISITVAGLVLVQDWHQVHFRTTLGLVVSTLFGIPLGLLLLTTVQQEIVKAILAACIIGFSWYSQEPMQLRQLYGDSPFGQGCLLARRLIEAGVPFVEVHSNHPRASAGWDTHNNNFEVTKYLVDWADPAWAALLSDLKDRGLLQRTLVIWMGEFGRTAAINNNVGRDHQHRAYTLALAGGGVRGGRVIGATSANGTEVTNRPVTVLDLFCTFCHALHIDPNKENETPVGRPVKIVDGGAPVLELFA
jgi:hypothetical protein